MSGAALLILLLIATTAQAQDALVTTVTADRHREGNGGGVSALWIHPRGDDMLVAGGTFLSLAGARWAYATLGGTRRTNPRTLFNAEANLGSGDDDRGAFRYVVLRGGVTRELLASRLYAEAEWLQIDVARQQDGIARIGATFVPRAPLTLRASLYQSLFGDTDTTLATARADYRFARVTAIAGFTGGTASPVLLQQSDGEATDVREVFGGVIAGAWTIIASAADDRQRLSVSWRLPMGSR
jgi:hypothetical protein